MQAYLTLTRRELGSFFYSWVGYVVIMGGVFLMGLEFVTLVTKLQDEPTSIPLTEIFLNFCYWIIVLFSAPVITMRLFASEKFSGTFETLLTTPVSDGQVVMAKFTASIIFYMIMWLPFAACVLALRYFASGSNILDPGTLGSTYLGIFLTGCLYMAAGCFASSLTKYQIVAAMISFGIGLGFFLASFMADQLAIHRGWMEESLNCISVMNQMKDFASGVVDTRAIVFCLTATGFFLFLTCRVLESRRWK